MHNPFKHKNINIKKFIKMKKKLAIVFASDPAVTKVHAKDALSKQTNNRTSILQECIITVKFYDAL